MRGFVAVRKSASLGGSSIALSRTGVRVMMYECVAGNKTDDSAPPFSFFSVVQLPVLVDALAETEHFRALGRAGSVGRSRGWTRTAPPRSTRPSPAPH